MKQADKDILKQLGFVESYNGLCCIGQTWLCDIWIILDPYFRIENDCHYDGRNDFSIKAFFDHWCKISMHEHWENEACFNVGGG